MTDDEYQRELKRIEREYESNYKYYSTIVSSSILGLEIAVTHIKLSGNAERKHKKIQALMDKMQREQKYKNKLAKKNTLIEELSKEKSIQEYLSKYKIKREVEERAEKFNLGGDYSEIDKICDRIASSISTDPLEAAKGFASDYIDAVYHLQNNEADKKQKLAELEKRKAKGAALEEESRNRQLESERSQRSSRSSTYNDEPYTSPSRRPSTYSDEPYTSPSRRPSTYSYDSYASSRGSYTSASEMTTTSDIVTTESIQRELAEKISMRDSEISDTTARKIEKHFKKEDNIEDYGDFYDRKNIKDMFKFYALTVQDDSLDSPTQRYIKMMNLGDLAVNIVYKDLMNGSFCETTKLAEFMRQFDSHGTLERYEAARVKYLNFYNKLNERDKKIVDSYAEKQNRYREQFGIFGTTGKDIASVDQIKIIVNGKIKNDYLKNGILNPINSNYKQNEGFNMGFPNNFRYSLKYMTEKEIAELYAQYTIRDNQQYYMMDTHSQEEIAAIEEARATRKAATQELFAEAIRYRFTKNYGRIDWENEEQKKAFLAKRERELVAVCRDFFHEQPLFPLNYIKQSEVEEGYASKRVEATNAVSEAKRRYYGMGKLKQVISLLKFGKLKYLGEEETLTDDELTSVNGMFR